MIELTRLRVFREVARQGSFTAAADTLGLAQPSVSHQIAQLEREVGARLVERRARRAQLTPAGETLIGHVEAVLVRIADAEREVAETAAVGARCLRVAAFATAAATLLPPAAGLFRRSLPAVELTLTEGDPTETLPGLVAGDYDVALTYDYPALSSASPAGVDLEPLFIDQMAVALPADHPLAGEASIHLGALADESWCAPHPCLCRSAFDQACRQAGFTARVMSETNDYTVMQGLVAAGAGVAVLPRLALSIAVRPGIVVRPLAGQVLERVTFAATRATGYRSPAVEVLRRSLRQSVTTISPPQLPLEPFTVDGADRRVSAGT